MNPVQNAPLPVHQSSSDNPLVTIQVLQEEVRKQQQIIEKQNKTIEEQKIVINGLMGRVENLNANEDNSEKKPIKDNF